MRSLVIDPQDARRLYFGTIDGQMYTSPDGGDNWSRVAGFNRPGLLIDNIIVDPRDSNVIYVAAHRHKESGGFFKTTDGGRTWREAEQLKGDGIHALTQSAKNPDLLFAGTNRGVWRSSDAGDRWEQLNTSATPGLINVESLAVDPRDSNVIYAGTWYLPYKTTDGGQTWGITKTGIIDDSDIFAIEIDEEPRPRHRLGVQRHLRDAQRGCELAQGQRHPLAVAPHARHPSESRPARHHLRRHDRGLLDEHERRYRLEGDDQPSDLRSQHHRRPSFEPGHRLHRDEQLRRDGLARRRAQLRAVERRLLGAPRLRGRARPREARARLRDDHQHGDGRRLLLRLERRGRDLAALGAQHAAAPHRLHHPSGPARREHHLPRHELRSLPLDRPRRFLGSARRAEAEGAGEEGQEGSIQDSGRGLRARPRATAPRWPRRRSPRGRRPTTA